MITCFMEIYILNIVKVDNFEELKYKVLLYLTYLFSILVGNAVPPILAKAIMEQVKKCINI